MTTHGFYDVTIQIGGHPVAKGRGRAVRTHAGAKVVTPEKTRKWEREARAIAREQMADREIIKKPVKMRIDAYFTPPKSWPKWKKEAALDDWVSHTSKPDIDNIVKAAKDALNGIVYMDDSQVVELVAEKRFDNTPAVFIHIMELEAIETADEWKQLWVDD